MVHLRLLWLQEPWFLVLFMLKPWLILVREHGNSERIIDVLVVVKLAITSTAKKVSQAYECSLPESDARASFSSICYVFIFSLDCSFFHGHRKAVHQLWLFAFSRKHELWGVAGADVGMALQVYFLFWATGMVAPWELVPYANCVLCI